VGHNKSSPNPVRNVVANAVRRERNAQGISQDQLAAQLQRQGWDVGRTTITKIELAERCVTDFELIAIAEALQTSVEALTTGVQRQKVRSLLGSLHR
jgi:transcriptional regulator with XRE-family HTH domain